MAAHLYWRINITATQTPDYGYVGIGYIEMRTSPGGSTACVNGTPIASSATVNSPNQSFAVGGASAGGPTSSSYPGWVTQYTTGWIGYKFANPISIVEIAYQQLTSGSAADINKSSPRDFTFDYSDDGVNWTTARSVTSAPMPQYHVFSTYSLLARAVHTETGVYQLSTTPPTRAYSLRRLWTYPKGPLVRIKVGSTETDIGTTTGGYLDMASMLALTGTSGSAVVTRWYDQSGNGQDAISPSGRNPAIIQNGKVLLCGERPSMYFNLEWLDIQGFGIGATPFTVVGLLQIMDDSRGSTWLSSQTTGSNPISFGFTNNNDSYDLQNNGRTDTASSIRARYTQIELASWTSTDGFQSGTVSATPYSNGTAGSAVSVTGTAPTTGSLRIGWNANDSSYNDRFMGYLSEILIWNKVISDRTTVEQRSANFFTGLPVAGYDTAGDGFLADLLRRRQIIISG